MNTLSPFAKPLYIMAKPAGSLCNLACKYCYYLEKSNLYQDNPKHIWGIERSGFFNGREKWVKGFENQMV